MPSQLTWHGADPSRGTGTLAHLALTTSVKGCELDLTDCRTSDLNDYSQCASENSMEVLLTTSISNIITDFIGMYCPTSVTDSST